MFKPQFTLPDAIERALYNYLLELKEAYGSTITISQAVRRLLITHPALSQPGASPGHPKTKDIPRGNNLPPVLEDYTYENGSDLMRNSDGPMYIAFSMARENGPEAPKDASREEISQAFQRWEDAGRPTNKKELAKCCA